MPQHFGKSRTIYYNNNYIIRYVQLCTYGRTLTARYTRRNPPTTAAVVQQTRRARVYIIYIYRMVH